MSSPVTPSKSPPAMLDSHHHFWAYSDSEYSWIDDSMSILRRDYLADEFLETVSEIGVSGSIAIQARQSREETDWLLEIADSSLMVCGVVGWLDLASPDLEEHLSDYESHQSLKGFRHVLQDEPNDRYILNSGFKNGLEVLAAHGYSYDALVYPRHLPYVEEALQRTPTLRCVIDHAAKPCIRDGRYDKEWADNIRSVASHTNVSCKLSGLVTEAERGARDEEFYPYLDHLVDCFGEKRLMIGSDWPVCLLVRNYSSTISLICDYVASRGLQHGDSILYSNAASFYGVEGGLDANEGITTSP